MKRMWILLAAVALAAGTAQAGDYHFGTTLTCSDCHVMHASQSHAYNGDAFTPPAWWEPTHALLKGPENQMCLSCHNENSVAPDVMGSNAGKYPTKPRSAGALNDVNGTMSPGYAHWTGHTMGSTNAAPGLAGSFVPGSHGLECTNCHLNHGRNQTGTVFGATESVNPFRNLRALGQSGSTITISYNRSASVSGTNPDGTFSTTNNLQRDVFQETPLNYEQDKVNLNEPNTSESGFGAWCTKCHVGFHGAPGTANVGGTQSGLTTGWHEFIRHPNSGVNIGEVSPGGGFSALSQYRNRAFRVRVMSPTGVWGTQGTPWTDSPTDITPTCLSCHKAHGSQRPFGLIYALGTSALGEDGDGSTAKHLCRQCHRQGAD